MDGPKFTPAQREANLLTVSDLYLRGKTQAFIGAQIGCSQQQVSGYLKKLYKRWEAAAVENIDRHKALELARIDKVESEAWNAWERSQREGQTGDPRFLELVNKCCAQRCKIIGIEAPVRSEIKVTDADIDTAIAAELARLAASRKAEAAGAAEGHAPAPDADAA